MFWGDSCHYLKAPKQYWNNTFCELFCWSVAPSLKVCNKKSHGSRRSLETTWYVMQKLYLLRSYLDLISSTVLIFFNNILDLSPTQLWPNWRSRSRFPTKKWSHPGGVTSQASWYPPLGAVDRSKQFTHWISAKLPGPIQLGSCGRVLAQQLLGRRRALNQQRSPRNSGKLGITGRKMSSSASSSFGSIEVLYSQGFLQGGPLLIR